MASRPRRSAAQKASEAITDMADRDNMSSSRPRRSGEANGRGVASLSRGAQDDRDHTYLNVKMPANKLRQATGSRQGASISVNNDSTPKRPTRGNKKNYVVDDSESDENDEGEDEIQVGAPDGADNDDDEDEEMEDADAEADADGEAVDDDMDVDAEGEEEDEDADGEEDVDVTPARPAPALKISKQVKASPSGKKTKQVTPKKGGQSAAANAEDSDDEELSDLDSDDEAMNVGDDDAEGEDEDDDEEVDADGEDIEEDAEGEAEADATALPRSKAGKIDSDDEDSDGEAPDLSKMTQRQRARFEGLDESHYQALSNEVQAKKVFTVEEKAMRRAEMARRRRNLSEKRNEEVKQETINKLLKKQASKTNRKNLAAIGEEGRDGEDDGRKPSPMFIRWTNSREGSYIAVPEEMMEGPSGQMFTKAVRPAAGTGFGGLRKMVEEVS